MGGTIWFGPHVPHGTLYVPFAVGMPSLPLSYSGYDMLSLDRRAAYWAHVGVETLAEARFKWIRKEVEAMQERMENHFSAVQAAADKAYARTGDLGMVYTANANWVTDQLWRFHDALLYRRTRLLPLPTPSRLLLTLHSRCAQIRGRLHSRNAALAACAHI